MILSRLISQLFLLSLIGAMGLLFVFTHESSSQSLYLSIASIALIALSLILERMAPLRAHWNADQGDTLGDVGCFVAVFGIVEGALKWLSPFVVLAFLPKMGAGLTWPLWSQIIAATLLIELGAWLSHWAHHKLPPLWALHWMHHSTERLYTLNNFRFHPLNHILNYLIAFLPLLLLGFDAKAMLGYTALTLPIVLFQHSNIRFDFGGLNHLLNTNSVHRWHHSAALTEGMRNFGRAFIIWDRVFGTFYNPSSQSAPKKVGLSERMNYPLANRTMSQILWPFSRQCCPQCCR